MEIDAHLLLNEIRGELESVADAMLAGAPDWETYVRLVERGKTLMQFQENIRITIENIQKATGEADRV